MSKHNVTKPGLIHAVIYAMIALTASAIVGWLIRVHEPDEPLGFRRYQQVAAGMTRKQVEAILGGPEGGRVSDPDTTIALVDQVGTMDAHGALQGKPAIWFNDRAQIVVFFNCWDRSGVVVGKQYYRPAPPR